MRVLVGGVGEQDVVDLAGAELLHLEGGAPVAVQGPHPVGEAWPLTSIVRMPGARPSGLFSRRIVR